VVPNSATTAVRSRHRNRSFNDASQGRPALPANSPTEWPPAAVTGFAPSDWTIIRTMILLTLCPRLPSVD
jgi:hypothetical protein